jgi:glycosyltransferase involved in cell wall biosynthesis
MKEEARRCVCLLCLSVVRNDPRVRKQADLLHDAGFSVVAVGLAGGSAANPRWPVLSPAFIAASSLGAKAQKLFANPLGYGRYLASWVARPFAQYSPRLANWLYWSRPAFRHLFETAQPVAADIYVANDWNMLPIASALAEIHGGRYIYDSHEYAAGELPESLAWRLFDRGLAVTAERTFIRGAAFVSTVSSGIADLLSRDHGLGTKPMVVRNVVADRARAKSLSPLRHEGEITVLFHGGITKYRGLHILVDSVRLWKPGRRLALRGPIGEAYRRQLERIIERHHLHDRVSIEPPVPADQLIDTAASADIGVTSLPDTSAENNFALPNKIFEYMSAGLALLVPELEELASIVRQYEVGLVFGRLAAEDIASAVNALDWGTINVFKAQARVASARLTWEREAEPWLRRIGELAGLERSEADIRSGG